MDLDVTINSRKRYETFIKRVLESKQVWGLESDDGWCVCESNEFEDTSVMLFWSDEAYARQCAIEEWSHYKPAPIELDEFMNVWLKGMDQDEMLAGVNWNVKLIGLEIEPTDLFKELGGVHMSKDKELEVSESGAAIYRHEEKEFEFEGPAELDGEAKEKFEEHIETYIGPITMVFHEIISHLVHIDVYHIEATEERPFHTLITHGMSDLAMNTPEDCEEWQYAELMCFLPPEWDLSEEGVKKDVNYWVVENLKYLARFPHEFDTWLAYGHTVQNGDPIEPFYETTKLCASLIIPTMMLEEEFSALKIRDDKIINIYNVFPIYKEEMDYKMKHGIDKLLEKFDEKGFTDVYDLNRKNACKRKWF